jgi:prevent-host-death family protein
MAATAVAMRELKARLCSYLRRVKAGETVEILERGIPIGIIVPAQVTLEARARVGRGRAGRMKRPHAVASAARGALAWSAPVSDLLPEDRA